MATPRQRACVALLLASALCAACGSNEATQGPEPDVAGDVLAADADVRPADVPADVAPDAPQIDVQTPTECLTGQVCAADTDCNQGERCNLTLVPPQCQLLYCATEAESCDPSHGDALCAPGLVCTGSPQPACCRSQCFGRECGSDGCGGSCGGCSQSRPCVGGLCCVPDCEGKQCGDDGCGSTCGVCDVGDACTPSGTCECTSFCGTYLLEFVDLVGDDDKSCVGEETCTLIFSLGSIPEGGFLLRSLPVRYSVDGLPLENAAIVYTAIDDLQGSLQVTPLVYTGPDGIADGEVRVFPHTESAVNIMVNDWQGSSVDPIHFIVKIE